MKARFFIPFTAFLLGLGACSSDANENPAPSMQPATPNQFAASKASSGFADLNFSEGDLIGLYIVQRTNASTPGVLAPSGNLFDNKHFTYTDGAMLASKTENYPAGVEWVDMYGYAPFTQSGLAAGNQLAFSVQSDQSTGVSTSDLLWVAKPAVQTTIAAPALVFSHKLSKVVVKLTAGIGVALTAPSVTINNTRPSVKLDMARGTLSAAQDPAIQIQAYNTSATEFCGIVVPQQVTELSNFITITNGVKVYNYTLPAAKLFDEGKSYTYEITVNTDDLSVRISGSVNDWNTGDTTTGDAQ